MGRCRNHPNKETSCVCTKYTIYMCEECLKCSDPDIYCKFRSACTIWFMDKKNIGLEEENRNESTIIRVKMETN
jgi:hypothetical protein